MAESATAAKLKNGIAEGRLAESQVQENFTDLHPPLNSHEALVAADRCYFCYDAPCVTACPTTIDIPLFIRQISTGNEMAAAETIFDQNILGGMCARVCPTETLCEQACVREAAEGKPVKIGLLQRFATDKAMAEEKQFYTRAASSGKKVAIVGAGPAGLACAHRLAMRGHDVVVYEARAKPGGLNEFGIAAYKTVDDFAQEEVGYVTAIGGIDIQYGKALGRDISLDGLRSDHDAVFLSLGLGGVNALGLEQSEPGVVDDAVDFIADLRQAKDKSQVPVGRRVVVVGGGMTAIDAAVQCKLLGAEEVTICYRRGQEHMNASPYEQELAAAKGVTIRHWLQPKRLLEHEGKLDGIELEYTELDGGKLSGTGNTTTIRADHILSAIGQKLDIEGAASDLNITGGRIEINAANGRTSVEGIWAGGDCTSDGEDLTVTAVAQGRDAAEDIHATLTADKSL